MLANIIVDKKAVRNKTFTYRIPRKINPKLGSLVLVPFRGKRIAGIVNSFQREGQKKYKIKDIESVIYSDPLLNENQFNLAKYISKKYYAPLSSVIFAILPRYLRTIKRPLVINRDPIATGTRPKNNRKTNSYLLFDPQDKYSFRIYQKAIQETLKRNQSIIFLTPDIDLSINKQIKELSQKSIILNKDTHSDKQLFLKWQEIKNGKYNLVIGSHLALFSPFPNLGLIIVHQENDRYYKNEQAPKYHLRDIALKLAELSHVNLILQANIPSLEAIKLFRQKKLNLIPVQNLNQSLGLRKIKIIDLKNERGLLSLQALKTIEQNLKNNKKTLLFLNRKGFSRFLICQDCGFSTHLNSNDSASAICPDCFGTNVHEHSFGTRRLEFELKKLFSEAIIGRLDKESEEIKNYDITIATSYIFKFDLLFDSVIIILAEIGLSLPDFRSEENLFYTLFRALRFGRNKIIQTFYPENRVIKYILCDDFNNFSREILAERQKNNYPPFSILIRITFDNKDAKYEANKLAKLLSKLNQTYGSLNEILGPAPVFIQPKNLFRGKSRNKQKYEIILKGKNPYPLLSLVPNDWKVDIDPIDLLK